MTAPSVNAFASFDDFLGSSAGQGLKKAMTEDLPGHVPASEGRAEVRVGKTLGQALTQSVPHEVRSHPDFAAFLQSASMAQMQDLGPDDVSHVTSRGAPSRSLGQMLHDSQDLPATPRGGSPSPRSPRIR